MTKVSRNYIENAGSKYKKRLHSLESLRASMMRRFHAAQDGHDIAAVRDALKNHKNNE